LLVEKVGGAGAAYFGSQQIIIFLLQRRGPGMGNGGWVDGVAQGVVLSTAAAAMGRSVPQS
jgi:hypothetical protein